MKTKPIITRFAPSPTGLLHKGHAYSAKRAHDFAIENDGRFLLRIEDIDTTRCKAEYTQAIYQDLTWLGIKWDDPVRIQSEHFADYQQELNTLRKSGLVYPCFCTRKEIAAEIAASPSAPHGPEGALYPGTCRGMPNDVINEKLSKGIDHAWRLNVEQAIERIKAQRKWPLYFDDSDQGKLKANPASLGDVVLARKDTPTSYHLSVTVDDGLQGITHIIRGQDLFHTTHIHVLLQALLGLPTPVYHHHKLITDDNGKRFAKRDKSSTLQALRQERVDPCSLFIK